VANLSLLLIKLLPYFTGKMNDIYLLRTVKNMGSVQACVAWPLNTEGGGGGLQWNLSLMYRRIKHSENSLKLISNTHI
jgi:hypothetical protein